MSWIVGLPLRRCTWVVLFWISPREIYCCSALDPVHLHIKSAKRWWYELHLMIDFLNNPSMHTSGCHTTSRASLTVRITVKNGNPPGTGKIWENRFFTGKMDHHGAKCTQIGAQTCQGTSRTCQNFFTFTFKAAGVTFLKVIPYQIIVADAADAVSVNFSGRCKFLQI